MPSIGGSARNRHAGPHYHGREDKGKRRRVGKNEPSKGGREGQGRDREVKEGF